jgi:hypothetical protein
MEVLLHEETVAVAPLNFTVPLPCVTPNPAPVMVMDSPVLPELGFSAVTLNPDDTVKATPLLEALFTTAVTFPVVAPLGTVTTMLLSLHEEGVATVPLNFTLLVPCVWPKATPVIVTVAPIPPFVGDTLLIVEPAVTLNAEPVVNPTSVVTTMLPLLAPSGTDV